MKLTKLNFVGEAAESKEFRNGQLVKDAKVRYGSYDMEVPIGRYNEHRMERILASFVNQFTSDDVRIAIDHPMDNNGHTCTTQSLKVHIILHYHRRRRQSKRRERKRCLKHKPHKTKSERHKRRERQDWQRKLR